MSTDFAFWKAAAGDPAEVFDGLAEGETERLQASGDVRRFRAELLARIPDLEDELEPGEFELAENPEDAGKYVLLTLGYSQLDHVDEILALAREHGLVGYSGVADEPIG